MLKTTSLVKILATMTNFIRFSGNTSFSSPVDVTDSIHLKIFLCCHFAIDSAFSLSYALVLIFFSDLKNFFFFGA